jgi:glycosyltransferase involved in cell wall biosynthesis
VRGTPAIQTDGQRDRRVLVVIPAYNEEGTIEEVVRRARESLSGFDLLVIDDGSRDGTGEILARLGVATARHLCNLGYGRAIQTAIRCALSGGYDVLITLDADGQHHPEEVVALYGADVEQGWDMLIGSRYVETRDYSGAPFGRRLGMRFFSLLVYAITGQRIYDTTSGLKVIRRSVFGALGHWHFIDFHAEAIVYLLRLGYRVGEYPVSVSERTQGQSMYSLMSHVSYPLRTSFILVLGVIQARLTQGRRS